MTAVVNIKKYLLPIIAAFISGTAFSKFLNLDTTNIFSLIFLFMLYHFYRASFRISDRKIKIVSFVCGFLYTASFVLIKLNDLFEEERHVYAVYVGIFYVIGFLLFFSNMTALIYSKLYKTDFTAKIPENYKVTIPKKIIFFFSSMIILLLSWFPYFMKDFPGNMTADSRDELIQALGIAPYSNHHPIVHTMMIKLFFNLGLKLFDDDQTLAVATYSICQAVLLSAAFSYLLVTLYKFKIRKSVILGTLVFYAFVSYHGIYSITMWKDIWFGGIILVLSTTIWRIVKNYRESNSIPVFELIMLFIFGAAMCLFRSNGLYAYILLVPFICLIFKKKIAPIIISIIVLPFSLIIRGPVYNSFGVIPPDTIESLSIPAQHIARAIKDGAILTQEEYDLLSQVVDVSRISEYYNSQISDPIKNLVRETDNQDYIAEHKKEFLKLWIDLGLDYPKSYLLAQIDQTYGYWYPDVQYWIYGTGIVSHNELDIQQTPKFSENTLEKVAYYQESYKDITYWGLFYSIGTASWICVFMFGLCLIKRKKSYLVIYMPVLAVLATLIIATPVFGEFRYAYSLFTTIPLLCIVPFCHSKKAEAAENKYSTELISENEIADSSTDNKELNESENKNIEEDDLSVTESASEALSEPVSENEIADSSIDNKELNESENKNTEEDDLSVTEPASEALSELVSENESISNLSVNTELNNENDA